MTTVCSRRPTLTSTRVVTSYSVATLTRNVLTTSPGRTSLIPYTTTSCSTRSSTRSCVNVRSTRTSLIPPRVYTTPVRYYSSRPVYYTSRVTLYSTSCSVSPRPTPAPRPTTSYVTTTTTQTLPTTTTETETSDVTFSTTATETGFDLSTVDGPTGTQAPQVDGTGTPAPKKLPIGGIVGGAVGGLAVAVLLGFLVYFLCFKKSKSHDQDDTQTLEYRRSIPLSAMDGQSSPSEASSAALNPLLQDGARHADVHGRQMQYLAASQGTHIMSAGHQYTHVRQDSMAGIGVVAMRPLSPATEQGYHYPQPSAGQYLGHAEVQDSRW